VHAAALLMAITAVSRSPARLFIKLVDAQAARPPAEMLDSGLGESSILEAARGTCVRLICLIYSA